MISSPGVAEQPLAAGVPGGDDAVRAEHADGVVGDAVDQQVQLLLGEPQAVGLLGELRVQGHHFAIRVHQFVMGAIQRVVG